MPFESESHEVSLWSTYVAAPESISGRASLDRLLMLHGGRLRDLAWRMSLSLSHIAERSDFEQHAILGAIKAYHAFDPKRMQSLSSFVFWRVRQYLSDAAEGDSSVQCPKSIWAARAYISGRYDGDASRRAVVEERLGVANISEAISKFPFLVMRQSHLSDQAVAYIEDEMVPSADMIVAVIDYERAQSSLSARQKNIYACLFQEECTILDTADRLEVPESTVRSEIRAIKQKLTRIIAR